MRRFDEFMTRWVSLIYFVSTMFFGCLWITETNKVTVDTYQQEHVQAYSYGCDNIRVGEPRNDWPNAPGQCVLEPQDRGVMLYTSTQMFSLRR